MRAVFSLTLLALAAALPARAADRHPVLLISIDGLRPDAVLEADRYGLRVPTLRGFLTGGSYAREVINVNPTVTNPNHTTLVTGVLPSEHGIYNNRPFDPSEKGGKSYSLYAQIKAPTLWGAAKAAGLKTGSLFWPVTDGAKDIDFNPKTGSDEDDGKIADDAIALIEKERPNLLTLHFVSLDHEEHKSGPFSTEANAILERIDMAVGRVIAAERKAHPDSVVAVVSDHGFFKVAHQVNLNTALVEAGFITLSDGPDKAVKSWTAFGWYVGGSAMIVLRDPKDQQTRARVKACLDKLAQDPTIGIEGVHTRDEITDLGFAPEAEFVVAFKTGYRMGMPLTGPLVIDAKDGAHGAFSTSTVRPDMHASFFIAGPGIAAGKDLGAIDMRRIAPTLAEALMAPLPSAPMPPLPMRDK
jgi:predicted AlkP superfamily pyrophosphatase or phosphodiesterase